MTQTFKETLKKIDNLGKEWGVLDLVPTKEKPAPEPKEPEEEEE